MQQWIASGENLNACETQLILTKSQETEMAREKELLTIKEMVDRGFSQNLACLIHSPISFFELFECYQKLNNERFLA